MIAQDTSEKNASSARTSLSIGPGVEKELPDMPDAGCRPRDGKRKVGMRGMDRWSRARRCRGSASGAKPSMRPRLSTRGEALGAPRVLSSKRYRFPAASRAALSSRAS